MWLTQNKQLRGQESWSPLAYQFCLFFLMHWPCSTVQVSPRFTINWGLSQWVLSDSCPVGSAGFLWKGTGSGEEEVETRPAGLDFWRRLDSHSVLQDSPRAAPHPPDLRRKAGSSMHLQQRELRTQQTWPWRRGTAMLGSLTHRRRGIRWPRRPGHHQPTSRELGA